MKLNRKALRKLILKEIRSNLLLEAPTTTKIKLGNPEDSRDGTILATIMLKPKGPDLKNRVYNLQFELPELEQGGEKYLYDKLFQGGKVELELRCDLSSQDSEQSGLTRRTSKIAKSLHVNDKKVDITSKKRYYVHKVSVSEKEPLKIELNAGDYGSIEIAYPEDARYTLRDLRDDIPNVDVIRIGSSFS